MKGNVLDFLKLVAENPELARRLGELASEYGFEFSDDELSDNDLDAVTGGTIAASDLTALSQLQLQQLMNQKAQAVQIISSIMKQQNDTLNAIIQNLK